MIDAIRGLLPPLLAMLDLCAWVQRHLHPPLAGQLATELEPRIATVAEPLKTFEAAACPDEMRLMRDRLAEVAGETVALTTSFVETVRGGGEIIDLYRALRRLAGVQERLYPLAPAFDAISRFFLEPVVRTDEALLARLREGSLRDGEPNVGVMHAANDRKARGGFSLYVPESSDGVAPMPLIVALHGGSGHGRDFLWTWVREARTRGMLVLSPTARDRTWSIMGTDDTDAPAFLEMFGYITERYRVDRARVLLTGMSDGGTYALLCGLREDMPFTHLAPACGVLHPFLFMNGGLQRAAGRPIYMINGALDWMFPVQAARQARDVLTDVGARLVYREIEDLSHTYPRDENPRILDWLTAT